MILHAQRGRRVILLIALFTLSSFIYYFGELVNVFGWEILRFDFWYAVHDVHRIIFLAPIFYCTYLYSYRGVFLGNVLTLLIFLPRVLFITPYADPILRTTVFILTSTVLSTLLALLLQSREHRGKLPLPVGSLPVKLSNVPRILFLILVLLVVGIIFAGYMFYSNYENNYRTRVENQLSAITNLKVGELVQYRNERLSDAANVFQNKYFSTLVYHYIADPSNQAVRIELQAWLSSFISIYQYQSGFLLDAQGNTIIAIPEPTTPVSSTILQHISETSRSGEVKLQDFYRNEYDHNIYLSVLVPIVNAAGSNSELCTLVLQIDPNRYLYPFINRWPIASETAETLLVRIDGDDVLYLNELRFQKGTALNLRIPLEITDAISVKAAKGQQGIVTGKDYRGVQVIADVRRVSDSPWFIIARMDYAEVYAPLMQILWMTIIIVGALLAGTSAGVVLIWRQQNLRVFKEKMAAAEVERVTNAYLESLFNYANVPIIVWDTQFLISRFNHAFENLVGKREDEVIGQSLDILFPPVRAHEIMGLLAQMQSGERLVVAEIPIRLNDGQTRTLVWNTADIFGPEGKSRIATIAQGYDITDYKQAETKILNLNAELEQRVTERTAQLEAANKELEAFAYSVSHDLRAPLRGIDGWSMALLEDCKHKLNEQEQEYLGLVRSETQIMGHLIDDLLLFSRQNRSEMKEQRLDLSAMALNFVSRFQKQNPETRAEFIIQPGLTAMGDAGLIEVVLSNLLNNAIKFSSKCSQAVIEFGQIEQDGKKTFFIRDNGVGFDMLYVNKLFGVFRRLHKSSEFPGTGIGLASVQRIINRHGGAVWAEAKVDQGATFYFTLKEAI